MKSESREARRDDSPFDLSGRVALVVGSSRGIGRALAEGLAAAGADVALAARTEADLHEAASSIRESGCRAECFPFDVSLAAAAEPLIAGVAERMGGIDILVDSAGITRRSPALDVLEEDWDAVLDINLKGAFFLSRAVARYWIEAGRAMQGAPKAKIIHIASLASALGIPLATPYAASKSGLLGIVRVLAVELAQSRICINAIAPGYIETDLTRPLFDDPDRRTRILSRIPMGERGQPEDLVGAAVFLASRASDYVTGQTIYVDGGWTAG